LEREREREREREITLHKVTESETVELVFEPIGLVSNPCLCHHNKMSLPEAPNGQNASARLVSMSLASKQEFFHCDDRKYFSGML
jgi:hypothetical protein